MTVYDSSGGLRLDGNKVGDQGGFLFAEYQIYVGFECGDEVRISREGWRGRREEDREMVRRGYLRCGVRR